MTDQQPPALGIVEEITNVLSAARYVPESEYRRLLRAALSEIERLTQERDAAKARAEAHRQDSEFVDSLDPNADGLSTARKNYRTKLEAAERERDALQARPAASSTPIPPDQPTG
jgi:hypothetical protein